MSRRSSALGGEKQLVELACDIGGDRVDAPAGRLAALFGIRDVSVSWTSTIGSELALVGSLDCRAAARRDARARGAATSGRSRRQLLDDPQRRREMARQPAGHGRARRHVHGVEQPQREFGVMALLVRRVRQLLHVEIGEDPQQCRAHIDAAAQAEMR